jgi:aerobic-type carbon monoxide dehydrogenase small subunit (CoxS/CutS family)
MQVQELQVNGAAVPVDVEAGTPLLSVLRDTLGLTGSKIGCGEGACGACTVLVGGAATRACITPVGSVAGQPIRTIEGLAPDDGLHPVQQAFLDQQAFQCGYCTPGMIMAAVALLTQCPAPTEADIVAAMQGNICRCGTYRRIIQAIQQAAATPAVETEATR